MSATKELLFKMEDLSHSAEMACYDSVVSILSLSRLCWPTDDQAVTAPTKAYCTELRETLEEALEYLKEVEAAADQLGM